MQRQEAWSTSASETGGPSSSWDLEACRYLELARKNLADGEIEAGWTALKAALRETIDCYGESELVIEGGRVCQEARDKLHDWRLREVNSGLCDALDSVGNAGLKTNLETALDEIESKSPEPSVTDVTVLVRGVLVRERPLDPDKELPDLRMRVKEARRTLDDHMDNVYTKQRLLGRHLIWGAILLVVSLVTVVLLVGFGFEFKDGENVLEEWRALLLVVALGALGASLSGLLNLLLVDKRTRIPDVRAQRTVVVFRPFIGGAGAVIAVGTLLALNVAGGDANTEWLYTLAFVAGFSERFVSRAVASASATLGS